MAQIVKISTSNVMGRQALDAVQLIRAGIGKLQELNGIRAEAIGVGAAEMESIFGIESGGGQAHSDRWGNLVDAITNSENENYAAFSLLRDLINATVSSG